MNRPTDAPPAWATDSAYDAPGEPYDGFPTKVVPTSGRKAIGHEPSKKPPAQIFNWFQNLAYLWLQYLADLVFKPVSATGLTVTVDAGAGTFTRSAGSFVEDGFAVGQHVSWSGFGDAGNNVNRRLVTGLNATTMTFADGTELVNVTDDAGCTVVAFAEVAGSFYGGGPAYFSETVEVADALTVSDDITYVDEHHSTRALCLSAAAFQPSAGSPAFSSSPEPTWTASGADFLYGAIQLPVGSRLLSVSAVTTRASGTITIEVGNHNVQTGGYALAGASLAISAGTTRAVTAVASVSGDADSVLEAGESISVTVALGANLNKFHGLLVTYDRP